jgi:hypothetical protein
VHPFARQRLAWFTEPKLAEGERRMVAQIYPRWNPLTSWMRQIEDFQRVAYCGFLRLPEITERA